MRTFILSLILLFSSLVYGQDVSSSNDMIHLEDEYSHFFPVDEPRAVLVLFPCFPCDGEHTLMEFNIVREAHAHHVAVLNMNFHSKLFLNQKDKDELVRQMQTFVQEYGVEVPLIFGGYSSGGNVALLLANELKSKNKPFAPAGVFAVDSPIDLLQLYRNAQLNIKRNFAEVAVQEAQWIVQNLQTDFGNPDVSIAEYQKHSPYTYQTENTQNLDQLAQVPIRLYTEPDTLWWMENRKAEYENLNAFMFKHLRLQLVNQGFKSVELIETNNKGYRINGDRHPHSWSIVDKEELLEWIDSILSL